MNVNKVFKAGIGYTIGNVLVKGISFISLPLFSRIMTPADFGIYSVFVSFDSLLFVLMGMALHSSVRNANLKFEGKIDDYISSITIIYLLNLFICIFIVLFFGKFLSKILGLTDNLLFLLVIHSFCSAIFMLYNTRISIDYSYIKYLIVSLCNSVCNIGLSLAFMFTIFKNNVVLGRVFGVTISLGMIATYVLVSFYKKSIPRPVKEYWNFGVKYSLPIIPHGVSQLLLSEFDRIMINSMVSSVSAGIYGLAGNLKLVLIVISDSVSTVWTTWFYEQAKDNDNEAIKKRACFLSFLFLGGVVILEGVSPELIYILGGSAYSEGKYVVIPMILDAYILFLYNIIVPSEYYKEKTVYIMLGTIFSAVLNILANYIFITKFGYIAAAYTTLFSYFWYFIFHVFISKKVYGSFIIPLQFLLLFFIILLGVSIFVIYFINDFVIRFYFVLFIGILILFYFLNKNQIRKKYE